MFLVVGSKGQLGKELQLLLGDNALYVDRDELDITNEKAVQNFFASNSFEAMINCAAYTAVDKAESEPETAQRINETGPLFLARTGVPMIQISTDYVFDGKIGRPYNENDLPHPLSVYGKTKWDGERAVLENASAAIVLRTSWLYSPYGNNFIRTVRRLASERDTIRIVFDQAGTPTCASDLAQTIVDLLPALKTGIRDLWHYSNEGVCSWYDFAREIIILSGLKCEIVPIESSQYPTAAIRPGFSVLNKRKIKESFDLKINHWQESLAKCLKNPSW